jgi:hypothetical protein
VIILVVMPTVHTGESPITTSKEVLLRCIASNCAVTCVSGPVGVGASLNGVKNTPIAHDSVGRMHAEADRIAGHCPSSPLRWRTPARLRRLKTHGFLPDLPKIALKARDSTRKVRGRRAYGNLLAIAAIEPD